MKLSTDQPATSQAEIVHAEAATIAAAVHGLMSLGMWAFAIAAIGGIVLSAGVSEYFKDHPCSAQFESLCAGILSCGVVDVLVWASVVAGVVVAGNVVFEALATKLR